MKIQSIIVFLFLLINTSVYTQNVYINDSHTDAPLGLVSIIDIESQSSVITNGKGIADITSIRDASQFEIRLIGYEYLILTAQDIKQLSYHIKLQPKDYLLNQVVVSAHRWSTEKAQFPSKIIGIKHSEIEIQNPQTTADLLNISGEVFIQKSQMGGGSPMIRGFSANRLLISVDGVRMNTAIFRGGNLQNIISLDPFSISNTEVIFGPGSVIYGSDALGGVMSFFSLDPSFSDTCKLYVKGNVDMRYSSANSEKTGHMDLQLSWEKFAMISSFSSFHYDDLLMGKYGPDDYLLPYYVIRKSDRDSVYNNHNQRIQKPTDYSQNNFMQKFRYRPNEQWDIRYTFHYSASSDVPRYDRLMILKHDKPKYAEWYYGPQIWIMNLLHIEHHHSTVLYDKFSIKTAYQHFEESRNKRKLNNEIKYSGLEKVEAFSVNVDFMKNIRSNDQLYYGIEGIYNDVISSAIKKNIISDANTDGASRYPKSNWASYAAYMNYNLHFNEQLLIIGGMRYNMYVMNAQFDTTFYPFPFTDAKINNAALVGSLGFNYQPGLNWVFTTNFSTGFRAPNIDDMGKVFDSEPGAVVVPNPDLKAEYIYNFELGLSKGIGEDVSIDARAFYSILKDAMVRRSYSLNGQDSMMYDGEMSKIQAIQNAAQARIWGFSLGLEAQLTNDIHFSTRYNFQKGEEEMADGSMSPSRHAAPMFGMSNISYQHHKWRMDLYAQYSGEIAYESLSITERDKAYLYAKDKNGNPYSPAWYTINYKLLYELNSMLHVSVGVENITNQRYRTYSSGIASAARNFIFSLNFKF